MSISCFCRLRRGCPPSFAPPLMSAALLLLGVALPLAAQSPTPSASSSAPAPSQQALQERSPLLAGVLQAVLPPLPLGYLYVGDLKRSLLPTGLMVVGSTLLVYETVELIDWTDESKSPALLYLGLGAVMGGYVYGIWDAVDAAKDHNARPREGGNSVMLLPGARGLQLVGRVTTR